MKDSVHLFGFWRSLATYRVRIALALKGIPFSEDSVNLLQGEQFDGEVARFNPQFTLPVMLHRDTHLTQSLAILEYINDCHPTPALLPENPVEKAKIRSFALISIADTHPLTVPRIRKQLSEQFNASDDQIQAWARHWSKLAFQAMESRLAERTRISRYCFSEEPGLADIALASQVAGSGYFGLTTKHYPQISTVMSELNKLDEFVSTSPLVLKDQQQ